MNNIVLKTKLRLFNLLRQLFFNKIISEIPHNVISYIDEIINEKEFKNKIIKFSTISNAHIENYKFDDDYPEIFFRTKSFDDKYIYKITGNIIVSPISGIVLIDDKILLESIGSLNRLLGWGNAIADLAEIYNYKFIDNMIINMPNTGYYHWLLESLPNTLHIMDKNIETDDSVAILIDNKSPKYLLDVINIDVFRKFKIIKSDKRTIKTNHILMTTMEKHSGFVRRSDIDIILKYFSDFFEDGNDKIYISRRKAKKRSLENEETLENNLRTIGFKIIYAEDYCFFEQIKIYSRAKFIVAPHGAGLANMIWCGFGTKIFEIFPNNHLHFCYATLAKTLNFEYDYIETEESKFSSGKLNVDSVINKIKVFL